MVKIEDHAHYVDILEKLQALEEQTKEMQQVLDEYNSYDDLPDEMEDMRNQLIEFLANREKLVAGYDKAIAEYKIELLVNTDFQNNTGSKIVDKIKDNAQYERILQLIKNLEEQTKEIQQIIDNYKAKDYLTDKEITHKEDLEEHLKQRKEYLVNVVEKAIAEYKVEIGES